MAGSNGTVLTDKGLRLLTKAQTGVPINFTRVAIGDGFLTPEQNLFEMLSLVNEVKSLEIQGLKVIGDGTSRVRVSISNQGVLEGFFIREIGLFAQDPDEGEILYCISNSGDLADYIPAGTGRDIIEEIIDIITIVGRAENITAIIDESIIHASAEDLKDLAGEGRINETVKGNADKIKELRTSFNQQIIESIGHGVMSGLKVIPQTPESMSVVVTSGIAYMSDGLRVELTSNSTVAIDISDTINPRIDIVYLNKNATIGYKAGIPETISTVPDIPEDSLLLSTVNVPANTTQIGDVNINDERRFKDTLEKLSEKLESFKAEVSTHLAENMNYLITHKSENTKNAHGISNIAGLAEHIEDVKVATSNVDIRQVFKLGETATITIPLGKTPRRYVKTTPINGIFDTLAVNVVRSTFVIDIPHNATKNYPTKLSGILNVNINPNGHWETVLGNSRIYIHSINVVDSNLLITANNWSSSDNQPAVLKWDMEVV